MAAKTLKNQYRLQIVTFKLSRKGKKTQTRKEKPKATYSMAFLSAENKNWQLEDLPQANFGRLPEIFRPLFVFVVFRRSFSSWALAPTLFTIFNWELSILLFSFINQIDFLVSKGLLSIYIYIYIYMINQIIHGCLLIWNYCSRELSSSTLEEKFHIYARPFVIL